MKFSIITPTYQRPDLLIRAIASVIEQTHTDWEMIIVNDSPDYDYSTARYFSSRIGLCHIWFCIK